MSRGKPKYYWYDYLLIPFGLVVMLYFYVKQKLNQTRQEKADYENKYNQNHR